MNTHTRITNTNFTSLDDLLELQLDTMAAKANQPKPPGPPDESDIVPVTDAATGVMDGNANPVDLPFMNLDPYVLDGKDNLPSGELTEGSQGNITSGAESSGGAGVEQLGFGLDMSDYTFRSSEGKLDIIGLTEDRTTEIKTINFNGEQVAVEYQSGLAYDFEGSYSDSGYNQLYVQMTAGVGTTVQAEMFDADGNPILTSYGYEQMLGVQGEAFDYGIEEFVMNFELMIDLQRNDFGMYEMTMSIFFEGEIVNMNGAKREYLFEDDMMFVFSSLDQVDPGDLPQGLYDEIARFANGMGDAWDAFGTFNDHLEAVLLQLKEDGHYQAWDDAGHGLDNPFDFDLPSIDPFS